VGFVNVLVINKFLHHVGGVKTFVDWQARYFGALLTVLCTAIALCSCSSATSGAKNTIVAWGDSLTYAATNVDGVWQQANPTWLQTIGSDLHVNTVNFGAASQGSAEIAVRQGGLKPLVTLADHMIPSGSAAAVKIVEINPNDGWTQYSKAGTTSMHGALAGVSGTLQHTVTPSGHAYSFVPDAAPSVTVSVPANSTFAGDQGAHYRNAIQIIWAGTNNSAQPEAIKRDIASMVNWIDPSSNRYLILGTIPEITGDLAATYGSRFVDLRGWLIANGLHASSVTPTAADAAAVAAGELPSSLTVDGTHLTQAAYTAIGHHLAAVIKGMNWT
jgi:lysophospholipase L1-like esterase